MENFNEVVGLYGRMVSDGRLENFDVALLAPNSKLDGFMRLDGTAEQLSSVREDADFQRLMTEATLIVDDLCIIDGYVNEGIAHQMSMFGDAIAKVPQAA